MIHLVAIQTSPGVWTITTTEMQWKILAEHHKKAIMDYLDKKEKAGKLIKKMRESEREWVEDQPHWSVIYDKEPE